jgi:nitroimidazol reductase NimA-like FMN-containing flavoprotein (pyridoxamine 5'-phosphate oxidase superfamily)
MEDAYLEILAPDECLVLLLEHEVGRISIPVDSEAPVVLPINYRLVQTPGHNWIALRTRPGNVIDHLPAFVAFEIDDIDPVRHAGWSVLVRGSLHRVDSHAAGFAERFDPQPWLLDERDSWLIIDPYAITGRRLHPAAIEWAFSMRAYL